MKRLLPVLVAATVLAWPAHTGASGHQLVVDGTAYDSTKEAGASIHWETYGDPQHAVFAERDQEWYPGDNGSEHLPCDDGIHWISNDNILTISHCLGAPSSTSTTTSSTTSTLPPTTTSTSAPTTSSSTTNPAPTTTAAAPTTTSSPTTSTGPSTTTSAPIPSTTSPSFVPSPTPTPSPTSTVPCTTGVVTDGVCQPVGTGETTTIAPKLPVTGSGDDLAPWAVIASCLGVLLVLVARRRV